MKCRGVGCGRPLTPDVKFCPGCGKQNKIEDSVICSSCGKTVEASAKFCCHCGEKVIHKQSESQSRICAGKTEDGSPCGSVLDISVSFCSNCGTKVDGEAGKTAPTGTTGIVHKDTGPELNKSATSAGGQDNIPTEQDKDRKPVPTDDDKGTNGEEASDCALPVADAQAALQSDESTIEREHTPEKSSVAGGQDVGSDGESVHSLSDQASAPVTCTDDSIQAEETSSSGTLSLQCSITAGSKDASESDSAYPESVQKGSDEGPLGRTVTGSEKSFFAEYADKPFTEKEIISMQNQMASGPVSNRDADPGPSNRLDNTQTEHIYQSNISSSTDRLDDNSEHKRQEKEHACTSSAVVTETWRSERGACTEELIDVDMTSEAEQRGSGKTSAEDHHAEKNLHKASGSETKDGVGSSGNKTEVKKHDKNQPGPEETNQPENRKAGKDKKNDATKTGEGARSDASDRDEKPTTSTAEPGRSNDRWQKSQHLPEGSKMSYAGAAGKGVTTRAMSAQNSGVKSTFTSNAEMVAVIFHVIVSDMWEEMEPDKYNIFIRCRPQALGSWEPREDKNKMTCIGQTGIGYLYEGKIMMKRDLRNSGFHYKYIAKKSGKDFKPVWELVQRREGGIDPAQVNRYFSIPEGRRKQTGHWHRYDGVAYFPGAFSVSVWNRVKGFLGFKTFDERVHHDAFSSAEVFLPSMEEIIRSSFTPATNGQTMMEGYLDKIVQVMSSLRFQMLDARRQFVDDSLVRKAVMEILALPLAQQLAQTGTVTLGLFILLLVEEFSLPADTEFIQIMCRSMLISPAMNNTTCTDLDSIMSHFPTRMANKSDLANRISRLINLSDQKGWWQFRADPSWLFCVPLLHFLQGKSQPYQDPEPSPRFRTDEWWGLTGLERRKASFMESTKNNGLSQELVEQLIPAFQVDHLFVRTLVASLDLEPLLPILMSGIVPLDVMAATLAHHVEHKHYLFDEHKTKIGVCLRQMISKAKEKAQRIDSMGAHRDLKELKCSAQIVHVLHEQLLKNKRMLKEDTLMNGTYLAFLALDQVALAEERISQENDGVQAQSWRQEAKTATEATCNWLSPGLVYTSGRSQALQMWDHLIAKVEEDINHGDLKQAIKKMLADGFEAKMEQLSPEQKLEVYLEQYNVAPAFADILNRLAFQSLDAAFEMESKYLARHQESGHLVSLLSAFIEGKWKELVKGKDDVLKFVITWIPMVNYFLRFGKKKSSEQLSEHAAQHIRCALECLQHLLEVLGEGNIPIKHLQLLQSNRERFLAIVAAADHDSVAISALLDLRSHELDSFIETSTRLDRLLEYCQHCFKTEDLPKVLRSTEELRDKSTSLLLSEVCSVSLPDSIKDLKTYKPKANPWKLSGEIHAILPLFGERMSSYIFRKMFSEFAKVTDLSSVEFWRAFHVVWSDVSKEWQDLCLKMTEGTITLAETERVFSMFRTQDGSYRYRDIGNELKRLSTHDDPGRWVDERIQQFTCFTTIKKHVKAASVLLNVKKAVNIAGDFGDIQKICSLSQDKNLPIGKVDRSVLRLCTQLEDVTPRDIKCLEDFLDPRCLEFVFWLKEKMKDGVKELNVFVDLAFISAGEEPWAIARVNCFHAATIGYAPLIFMEKGEGCRHFLQQCRLVFDNVAADPSLPGKLKDTSRYLDWFKDVENSLGSVEKTCLSQVSSINERGVFRIGRGGKTRMIDDGYRHQRL